MNKATLKLMAASALALMGVAHVGISAETRPLPPYPEGYRQWTHVKSVLISAGHASYAHSGGFHHIYANDKAESGYRAGQFPEGSIIVVDWIAEQDEGGRFAEGPRQRVDVMIKDSGKYASTGGWGFERFKGDSRVDRMVKDVNTECFACHASRKDNDLVFSTFRD